MQNTQEKRRAQRVSIVILLLPKQVNVEAAFVFSRKKVVRPIKMQCYRHPIVLCFSLPQTISTICISLENLGNVMDTLTYLPVCS